MGGLESSLFRPHDYHVEDERVFYPVSHASPKEVASWPRLNSEGTTPLFRAAAPILR
jgi:hypothetical protein